MGSCAHQQGDRDLSRPSPLFVAAEAWTPSTHACRMTADGAQQRTDLTRFLQAGLPELEWTP